MKKQKQWYIVYVHAGTEMKTLYALHKKGFECFCPTSTAAAGAGHKNTLKPLIPNYIFVHIAPEEQSAVRRIDGVVNFMYWLGEEVAVNEEDIYTLKELTEKYQVVAVEKISVNAAIPCTKEWTKEIVNSDNDIDTEEEIIKIDFPAYGFAITAKETKMSVRVINIDTSRNWQKIVKGAV